MNNIIYPISAKSVDERYCRPEYDACVLVLTTDLAVTFRKLAIGTKFKLLGCVDVFNLMDHG